MSSLSRMEGWRRCAWCGDTDEHMGSRSALCDSCKEWRRRELRALAWKGRFPNRNDEESLHYKYRTQFATLCREAGNIDSWKRPVSPLQLEWELMALSERLLGENLFGSTAPYFDNFSPAQRRLLMYLFQRITKAWLRHHRRSFAIEKVMEKAFPRRRPYGDG